MDEHSRIKEIRGFVSVFLKNLRWTFLAFVLGWLFVSLLNLIPKDSLQVIRQTYPLSTPLYLFYIVILVLIYNVYNPSEKLFVRFKNNYELEKPPFTYVHGITVFLISSILLSFIFIIKPYIVAFIFIPFVAFLIACFFKTPKTQQAQSDEEHSQRKKDDNASLFHDDPIRSPDEDTFGRDTFVNDIYKQITKYSSCSSYVFGILGTWGTGKTSVLNLLRYKLTSNAKDNENEKIMVLDFDPWDFSPKVNLINAFYERLYKALNQEYLLSGIKNTFKNYLKIISPGLKLHSFGMTVNLNYQSPEAIKKEIEMCLRNIGKKVVIFIDDIDRLDKERILQVFEIVKRSANLNKTIFILSFDVDIVSRIVDGNFVNGKSFIEKIIQSPINLPAIEQVTIKNYVFGNLELLFNKIKIDQKEINGFKNEVLPGNFKEFYKSYGERLFSTLRHAIRYLNAINITLPAIKDEVNLHDFLLLELIRIFYPDVYDDIWNNQSLFITPSIEFEPSLRILYATEPTYRKDLHDKIKTYLDRIKNNYEQNKYEILEYLLKTLFPLVKIASSDDTTSHSITNQDRIAKRIFVPEVFPKYFMLKVPHDEIPDKEIKTLIDKWDEQGTDADTVKNDLLSYKENQQLSKLFEKLSEFKYTLNNTAAERVIEVLYKNIDEFVDEDLSGTKIVVISHLIIYLINDNISSDRVEQIILDLIKDTPSIPLAESVITFCKTESSGGNLFTIYANIHINELEKAFLSKLHHELIEDRKNIFNKYPDYWPFILMQWAKINDHEKANMNDYVVSLIDNNPNYLGKLITLLNRENSSKAIFDSKKLYDSCKKVSSNTTLTQESKNAIASFIKDYKNTETTRIKEIREQSDKDKYNKLDNEIEKYLIEKKYKEALDALDKLSELQAESVRDLSEQRIAQIHCRKWKCLLELSLNNYNPLKEYFDRANDIANDENSINNLINSSYPTVNDQPNFQIYYCLFYFLKWHFSEQQEEKENIKSSFLLHYALIAEKGEQNIKELAEELKKKMGIPD